MATRIPRALVLTSTAALVLTGCQFSFSSGGLDYDKLKSGITEQLNSTYAPLSQQVSSVECPEDAKPGPGDKIVCTATVGDQSVRVESTVTDEDYNVNFSTLDSLYDLDTTAGSLSDEMSDNLGFPVTVDCGQGLKAVEIGQTFDCTATDQNGAQRTVRLTAGAIGEDDRWELVDDQQP